MCSPAGTSEVFILTFKLPADFKMNILLLLTSINKLLHLLNFRRCREKWGAEQPCIWLQAKKKGLAPTLCAMKSCTSISTKRREKGMCLLQHWKHLFACRTQNRVLFFLHCRLLRVQKCSPHAAAKSWLSPSRLCLPSQGVPGYL